MADVAPVDVPVKLLEPVDRHKELVVGELANGFRYVVLPNKTPPQRFEVHLEVHAGSVDEKEDEQVGRRGLAAGGEVGLWGWAPMCC